jgi:integrase
MSGSFFQNPKTKTWYARINAPRGSDGKRRQIRLFGKTKHEVEVAAASLLIKLNGGYDPSKRHSTISEVLDSWLQTKHDVEFRTRESYESTVRLHLKPTLGKILISKLTRAQVQSAISNWHDGERLDGKLGKRGSRTTLENIRVLRAALKLAVIDGLRSDNPADHITLPKRTRPKRQSTTASGAGAIISAAEKTLLFAPLYLAFAAGLRRGEIVALQRADVDLDARILHVRRSVVCRGKRVVIKEPKTEAGTRSIPIAPGVFRVLEEHLRHQKQRLQLLGVEPRNETFLFDRYDGQLWHPDAFGKSYRKLIKNNSLPLLRLHGTRHSFASIGLAEGVQTKVMSRLIGHESEILTLSVYTHVEDQLMIQATTKIGAALTRALGSSGPAESARSHSEEESQP